MVTLLPDQPTVEECQYEAPNRIRLTTRPGLLWGQYKYVTAWEVSYSGSRIGPTVIWKDGEDFILQLLYTPLGSSTVKFSGPPPYYRMLNGAMLESLTTVCPLH
jgi:hypothetical protein